MRNVLVWFLLFLSDICTSQVFDDDTIYPNTCQPTRLKCQAGCWWSGYATTCNGSYTCKICARVGRGYYSPTNNDNRYLCPSGRYSSIKQAASCSTCDPSLYNGLGSTYKWGNYCMLTSMRPSTKPSHKPSKKPVQKPSKKPVQKPSKKPSKLPSEKPSMKPSREPSKRPHKKPSGRPSQKPSRTPSRKPSNKPSKGPSRKPSHVPSLKPSIKPSKIPTWKPSHKPSSSPSIGPSNLPIKKPTMKPSKVLTEKPSKSPSKYPIRKPSQSPSGNPSEKPSPWPSIKPSLKLSQNPSKPPTKNSIQKPSIKPSRLPTKKLFIRPSRKPSKIPSPKRPNNPSRRPTFLPMQRPSKNPSKSRTQKLNRKPSRKPSRKRSPKPTHSPSIPPTKNPTQKPSIKPSRQPSRKPCSKPSRKPSEIPSHEPSKKPSKSPIQKPFKKPSRQPAQKPYSRPSRKPRRKQSHRPSQNPSRAPSHMPFQKPYLSPSRAPLEKPYGKLSWKPSRALSIPSRTPGHKILKPSRKPSKQLSRNPQIQLSLIPSRNCSEGLVSSSPAQNPSSQPSTESSSVKHNPSTVVCKPGFTGERCDQCCDAYTSQISNNGVVEKNPKCTSSGGDLMRFYFALGDCVKCPGKAAALLKYVSSVILLLSVAGCALYLCCNPRMLGLFDVSIHYLQCFSLLRLVNVSWPTKVFRAINALSIANFDSSTAAFRCYYKVEHSGYLAIIFTLPFVSSFLKIGLDVCAQMTCLKRKSGALKWSRISSTILLNMYFFFLQWNAIILQHILCGFRGVLLMKSFISSDYCHEYNIIVGEADGRVKQLTTTVLLAFVIPLVFVTALFLIMKKIVLRQNRNVIDESYFPIGKEYFYEWRRNFFWFYGPYKVDLWYWPFMTLAQKNLLIIFLSVFHDKVAEQVLTSLIFLAVTILCEIIVLPFNACLGAEKKANLKKASQKILGALSTNNNFINVALRISFCILFGCAIAFEKESYSSSHLRRRWAVPLANVSAFMGFAMIATAIAMECCKALARQLKKSHRLSRIAPTINDASTMELFGDINEPHEDDLRNGMYTQESNGYNGGTEHDTSQGPEFQIGEESTRTLTLFSEPDFFDTFHTHEVRSSVASTSEYTTIEDLSCAPIMEVDGLSDIGEVGSSVLSTFAQTSASNKGLLGEQLSVTMQRRDIKNRRGLGLRLYYPMGTQPLPAISRSDYVRDDDLEYRPAHVEQSPDSSNFGTTYNQYPITVQNRKEKKGLGLRLYYPTGTKPSSGYVSAKNQAFRKKNRMKIL